MTKAYIAEDFLDNYFRNKGPLIRSRKALSAYGNGYILSFELYEKCPVNRRLDPAVWGGVAPTTITFLENQVSKHMFRGIQHRSEKLKLDLYTTVNLETYICTDKVDETAIREIFVDWFQRFKAISGCELDLTGAFLRAQKWYKSWHAEFDIRDIIE